MSRDPEIRAVFKDALIICGVIFLSTLTRNWAMLGLVFYGIAAAAKFRPGDAICSYLLLTFLQVINHVIMPRYPHFAIMTRLGSALMTFALILSASTRRGQHRIPLGSLFLYLAVAFFTSFWGYFPLISHLKILNFAFFIIGLYIGTKNINQNPEAISQIRHFLLALVLLLTYGSIMTLPFPAVAYFTSVHDILRDYGLAQANETLAQGVPIYLFSGITNHSQYLGPTLACLFGWLLCDMWLVKKRLSKLHLFLLVPIPVICFMTRSRIALLILLASLLLTTLFCLPRARVSRRTKSAFWGLFVFGFFVLIMAAIFSELKDKSISRWIRKTDDVTSDDRTLGTAITSSRQGLIDMNLNDFKRNPLLGSGFQVAYFTRDMYNSGRASLFSATIEKGLLPLMILGETGILGALAFSVFLISFYSICKRKHYTATSTLLSIFLLINLAEANFFAPSGGGGTHWILLIVGGFIIDMQQYAPVTVPIPLEPETPFIGQEEDEDGNQELFADTEFALPLPNLMKGEEC